MMLKALFCDFYGTVVFEDSEPIHTIVERIYQSGMLAAGDVVHIGDSVTSDVEGAGRAGIQSLWLNRGGRETPAGVGLQAGDLLEALRVIKL